MLGCHSGGMPRAGDVRDLRAVVRSGSGGKGWTDRSHFWLSGPLQCALSHTLRAVERQGVKAKPSRNGGPHRLSVSIAGLGMAQGMVTFILFAAGVGISMGIAFTAVGALISEVVRPDARGLAMGGYNSAIYIGMMLSSFAMGAVIQEIGFRNAFLIVAMINLAATGLFHLVFSRPVQPLS